MRSLRGVGIGVLTGLLLLGSAWFALRARRARETSLDPSPEESMLVRQNQELARLVDAAEKKTLLNFDDVLVIVDQSLVQDLVRSATPLEGNVGDGFHVRIDSASASFGDGLALVRLDGSASLAGSSATADIAVSGGLEVVDLDPASGVLRCRVSVFNVEATHAQVLSLGWPLGRLSEALTHGGLSMLLKEIEIPVRLENRLSLPAVNTKRLRIEAAELPLRMSVTKIRVFSGKLWVFVNAVLAAPAEAKAPK